MRFSKAFVRVVPATIVLGVASEVAANPPPPSSIPDPPLTAPTRAEAPNVVRTHGTLCFAFYPSGGTLAMECPKELLHEPVGEALVRHPDGKCVFTPITTGTGGRTDTIDKCPSPPFEIIAEKGVIPDWSKKLAADHKTATEEVMLPTPMPARLGEAPAQEVGCGVARGAAGNGLVFVAIGAVATARRRKKTVRSTR